MQAITIRADLLLLLTALIWGSAFVAQRDALASHVVIILSPEAVFAVVAAWLFLDEQLTPSHLVGCGLMLGGMLPALLSPSAGRTPPKVGLPKG